MQAAPRSSSNERSPDKACGSRREQKDARVCDDDVGLPEGMLCCCEGNSLIFVTLCTTVISTLMARKGHVA